MLNGKAFDDASSPHIKLDTQKAVISHEFGHAFGLAHNMGSSANSSIMRANDWYVHKPGLIDLQTINYLYG